MKLQNSLNGRRAECYFVNLLVSQFIKFVPNSEMVAMYRIAGNFRGQ